MALSTTAALALLMGVLPTVRGQDCALGCAITDVKDGFCDNDCLNFDCNYDLGDCCPPDVFCVPGSGFCTEYCNRETCAFDGGDCDTPIRCNNNCNVLFINNGICDPDCNNEDCNFDGGDCGNFVDIGIGGVLGIVFGVLGGMVLCVLFWICLCYVCISRQTRTNAATTMYIASPNQFQPQVVYPTPNYGGGFNQNLQTNYVSPPGNFAATSSQVNQHQSIPPAENDVMVAEIVDEDQPQEASMAIKNHEDLLASITYTGK